MRVRAQLTIVVVLLLLGALGAAGALTYRTASGELRDATAHRLEDVARLKVASYEQWVVERTRSLEQLARRALLQEAVATIAATPVATTVADAGRSLAAPLVLDAELQAGIGFERLFVVSARDGHIVAATDPTLLGTLRAGEDWFVPGLRGSHVARPRWSLRFGETVMPVVTPIAADGEVVALLVGHAALDAVDAILVQGQDESASEDTYLVNVDNFPLTATRFQDGPLRPAIRTDGVTACLAGQSGVTEYLDYRGVPVIGAYRWMPEQGTCLVTEVDRSEALAPLHDLRVRYLVLVSALLAVAVVVAALVARRATRPLTALVQGAQEYGGGNLDARLNSTRSDEFGDLAQAMDDMASRLQTITASRDDLNREVARRAVAEGELADRAGQLARSNEELQQFAYVASHDLQEPLRMVTSYVELLSRRYQGRLDADADEFIAYAVDGAVRMKALINDLLTFSRVETQAAPDEPVTVALVLDRVRRDLELLIGETGATLVVDVGDATVMADPRQMAQLFQNLVSNAVKFHGADPPVVQVTAERSSDTWTFHVRDNGIGIEARHFDRIFVIFQRLRDRDDATGTGIGLAVCKKIVERHHGRLWVDSVPGEGTTFHVALPRAGTIHERASRSSEATTTSEEARDRVEVT